MADAMREVYGWVKTTRKGLLQYCVALPAEALTAHRDDFGHGSMAGALIHIADCYRYWLAKTVFGRSWPGLNPADFPDAARISRLFEEETDPLVDEFLAEYGGEGRLTAPLELRVPWLQAPLSASPLWLMTHVITHEFHHKGQAVTLGRMLGYPPPETDLAMPGAV